MKDSSIVASKNFLFASSCDIFDLNKEINIDIEIRVKLSSSISVEVNCISIELSLLSPSS